MKKAVIALLAAAVGAYAAGPFVIFASDAAASDPATLPLAQKYLSPQDYLGFRAVSMTPQLKGIVEQSHLVEIFTSLADLQKSARLGCGPQAPSVLYYQWAPATPIAERNDPAGTIARAAAMVAASGCQQLGLIPERIFFAATACVASFNGSLFQQIDWSTVAFFDTSGNWLIGDECAGHSTVKDYVAFVESFATSLRQKNPRIVLTAHLSFGSTQPATMVQAAEALGGIVDGFLIAYPLSPANQHLYSTAPNLGMLLDSLRPR